MLPLLAKHRSWCAWAIIFAQQGCSLRGENESPGKTNRSVRLHSFCQDTTMLIPALEQFKENKHQSHLRDMNQTAIFSRLPRFLRSPAAPPGHCVNPHFLQMLRRKAQARHLSKHRTGADILPNKLGSSVSDIGTPWSGVWASWDIFLLKQIKCKIK